MSAAPRIAIYTHDTYGLGHVRRCGRIIDALSEREPGAALLLVTGSPALGALDRLPPNADVLKLPTIVKTGAAEDRPPHLPLEAAELTALRSCVTSAALASFRPDVLLVDNFPLGSMRELAPVLAEHAHRGASAVLGLRDIVDHPDVVRRTWTRESLYDVIEQRYARVLVYGRREVFDVAEAYGLSGPVRRSLRYCGYVTDRPLEDEARADVREVAARFGLEPPLLVATAGGGGDGYPLLSSVANALHGVFGLSALLVTGPLMSLAARERLGARVADLPRAAVVRHVPDLPSVMDAADVLITMGGYNTMAELIARGRRAIVVPRDWRYGEQRRREGVRPEWEQRLRAEALERLGLVRTLATDAIDGSALARLIEDERRAPNHVAPPWPASGRQGAARVADELLELVPRETTHALR